MATENNGGSPERARDEGNAAGGEDSTFGGSDSRRAEGGSRDHIDGVGSHQEDPQSKRIGIYGVDSLSTQGRDSTIARSAAGSQEAVLLGEIQVNLDSAYNGEVGSPSHSSPQQTSPHRAQASAAGVPGGSKHLSGGAAPRRLRPIAPKGDSPRLSTGGHGKSSPGSGTPTGKRKPCNCKQSRCLKLYCECFASGAYCEDCNCVNCYNNPQHEQERQEAVNATLERDSNAFRNKITIAQRNQRTVKNLNLGSMGVVQSLQNPVVQGVHTKGCNCKKSHCLKKYCECFQANIYCGDNCKCSSCKNFEGSEERRLLYEDPASPVSMSPSKRPRYPGSVNAKAAAAIMAGQSTAHSPSARPGMGSPVRHARDHHMMSAQGVYPDTSPTITFLPLGHGDPHAPKTVLAEILTPDRLVSICKKLLDAANNEGQKFDKADKDRTQNGSAAAAAEESKKVDKMSAKGDEKSVLEELECDEEDDFVHDGNDEDEQERTARDDLSEKYARQERVVYEEFQKILEKLLSEVQRATGSIRQEDMR